MSHATMHEAHEHPDLDIDEDEPVEREHFDRMMNVADRLSVERDSYRALHDSAQKALGGVLSSVGAYFATLDSVGQFLPQEHGNDVEGLIDEISDEEKDTRTAQDWMKEKQEINDRLQEELRKVKEEIETRKTNENKLVQEIWKLNEELRNKATVLRNFQERDDSAAAFVLGLSGALKTMRSAEKIPAQTFKSLEDLERNCIEFAGAPKILPKSAKDIAQQTDDFPEGQADHR